MTKFLLAAVAVVVLTAPGQHLLYRMHRHKGTALANRPDGNSDPRYQPVNKGDKVATSIKIGGS